MPQQELRLRPYQQTLADDVFRHYAAGLRVLFQLPTGGGKTELLLDLACRRLPAVVLTHRQELVDQLVSRAEGYGLPIHDAYHAREYNPAAINVQSIGKFSRRQPAFDATVLVDEAHHAVAKTWHQALRSHRTYIGCTATPWRLSKKQGFDHLFDTLLSGPQTLDLIDTGYLAPLRLIIPKWSLAMRREIDKQVRMQQSDYSMTDTDALFGQSLTASAVDEWRRYADGLQTIFYATSCPTAVRIARLLADHQVAVGLVLSDVDQAAQDIDTHGIIVDRKEAVDQYRAGTLTCLVNYELISEGFDVPAAQAVVIARPTRSLVLHRQATGRALRPGTDKEALILDLAANSCDPQVGHPLTVYPWTLAPRNTAANHGEPPIVYCDACDECLPASVRNCYACNAPMGQSCQRCGMWRGRKHWLGWNDGRADDRYCNPCRIEQNRTFTSIVTLTESMRLLKPVRLYKNLETAAFDVYSRKGLPEDEARTKASRRAYAICINEFRELFPNGCSSYRWRQPVKQTAEEVEMARCYLDWTTERYLTKQLERQKFQDDPLA